MGYRVAVVGATGNVGREMLNILEEVNFPVEKVHAIASRNSIGLTSLTERVSLAGGTVEIFSRISQGTRIHAEFPLGGGKSTADAPGRGDQP